MRLGIDFATKDFFCAGHCQLDYVLTQRLAKPRRILLKLGFVHQQYRDFDGLPGEILMRELPPPLHR